MLRKASFAVGAQHHAERADRSDSFFLRRLARLKVVGKEKTDALMPAQAQARPLTGVQQVEGDQLAPQGGRPPDERSPDVAERLPERARPL